MGHIKSESFDTDGGIYLYTKEKPRNPHGKRTRLGGKFRSHGHARDVSRAASEAVGPGTEKEYQEFIARSLSKDRRSKDKRK